MKAADLKLGQKVRFTQNEEVGGYYDNYFGSMSHTSNVEYVGIVKEIVSKTCVIVMDMGGDTHPVEPRKIKLEQ
jgi:hypothetical protein